MKQKKQTKIETTPTKSNEDWHRVGFIGISNWVLDPAKMNRGIFVNRCSPSINELKDIVVGICKNDENVLRVLEATNLINSLSSAYLKLCELARNKTREFFGLRDFYSLIKMIYWHIKEHEGNVLDWSFLDKAIKRNFGGLIDIDPTLPFLKQFKEDNINLKLKPFKISVIDLVKEALLKKTTEDENRYLLLLSQNDNALDLINNYILNEFDDSQIENKNSNVKIIFGSSFPNDQKYHQICRKIHQIKLSMELGKTVILLNLENLYESLYDALNQFYHKFGDNEKFVDLGLGTQRVKCLVHNDFRLIVVADKKSVYNPKKYPIPLVNRLEKHLLCLDSILNDKMKWIVGNVKDWCNQITLCSDKNSGLRHTLTPIGKNKTQAKNSVYLKPSDIFIGYTEDTIASLVFKQYKEYNINMKLTSEDYEKNEFDWSKHAEEIIQLVKNYLLQCATSDAIIRLLQITNNTKFKSSSDLSWVVEKYFIQQPHDNFNSFFQKFCVDNRSQPQFVQLTTHSKLMSKKNIENIVKSNKNVNIRQESLHNFDTQVQFSQVLREFYDMNLNANHEFGKERKRQNILIIQCDCAHFYQDLVNCARFTIIDEFSKYLSEHEIESENVKTFTVFLILQIPKIKDGCISGFQTAKWFCYHIDDLQDDFSIGNVLNYKDKRLSELFSEGILKQVLFLNSLNYNVILF